MTSDSSITFRIHAGFNKSEITRTYFSLLDVFSSFGGQMILLKSLFYLLYGYYNYYKMNKHIATKVVIGNQAVYPREYHLEDKFCKIRYHRSIFRCCLSKVTNENEKKLLESKYINMKACDLLISEKMALNNYIHDSIDLFAIKQLMLKGRHMLLMPLLVLNLTKTKKKASGGYQSSFIRNIHERTDTPVFTVEEAVKQIKNVGEPADTHKGEIEKAMDSFFVHYLPEDIIGINEDANGLGLDEDNIMRQRRELKEKAKKAKSQYFRNTEDEYNSMQMADNVKVKKNKVKSDFTLGIMDSSNLVKNIMEKQEVEDKLKQKRTQARSTLREVDPINRTERRKSTIANKEEKEGEFIRKATNRRSTMKSSFDGSQINKMEIDREKLEQFESNRKMVKKDNDDWESDEEGNGKI